MVTTIKGGDSTIVNKQWAIRPPDQRFLSLESLERFKAAVRQSAFESVIPLNKVQLKSSQAVNGDLYMETRNGPATLTHWAAGQLATRAGAPAAYLRKLPSELALANLLWGMAHPPEAYDLETKVLTVSDEGGFERSAAAFTSSTYGRIWDIDVVHAVQRVAESGTWKVPSSSYSSKDPLRATTLYASDRDCFMFLVDEDHPIGLPGYDHPKYRGFVVWNSEVGNSKFGLMTMLYDYVCDNRLIWGMDQATTLFIRHTSGGPDRFAYRAAPALRAYADGSVKSLTDGIAAARTFKLAETEKEAEKKLVELGLTQTMARLGLQMASNYTDGNPLSVWNLVEGVTEASHLYSNQDDRFAVESIAGRLMERVQ